MGSLLSCRGQSPRSISSDVIKCSIIKTKSGIFSVDCAPNGKHFVCATRLILQIYCLTDSKQVGKDMKRHNFWIVSVQYSRSGQLIASASLDSSIRIWNSISQEQIRVFKHQGIDSVSFSPNDLSIVIGNCDHSVRICKIQETNEKSVYLQEHNDFLRHIGEDMNVYNGRQVVQYSKNGKYILAVFASRIIKIWKSQSSRKLINQMHKSRIFKAQISEDGELILSAAMSSMQISSLRKGKILRKYTTKLLIYVMDYSPEQTAIVFSDRSDVFLWNIKSGLCTGPIGTKKHLITSIKFTIGGQFLVIGSANNYIEIDQVTKEEISI